MARGKQADVTPDEPGKFDADAEALRRAQRWASNATQIRSGEIQSVPEGYTARAINGNSTPNRIRKFSADLEARGFRRMTPEEVADSGIWVPNLTEPIFWIAPEGVDDVLFRRRLELKRKREASVEQQKRANRVAGDLDDQQLLRLVQERFGLTTAR